MSSSGSWRSAGGSSATYRVPTSPMRCEPYDEFAEDYTAIVADWDASVVQQGEIIDQVIRGQMADPFFAP